MTQTALTTAVSSSHAAGPATTVAGATAPVTMTPPFSSKFQHGGAGTRLTAKVGGAGGADAGGAGLVLRETRSPVSFREGRRASDGVMLAQHGVVVAFRQQLRDTTKTRGVAELRQQVATKKEQSRGHMRQLSLDGSHPTTSTDADERPPKLGTKRRSYPSSADSPVEEEPQKIGGTTAGGYATRGAAPLGTQAAAAPDPPSPATGGTAVVFPPPKSTAESLHQNIVQTRLQQLLQSARPGATPATSQPAVSELHQQLQQLHVATTTPSASPTPASTVPKLPADVDGSGAAATAIFHSTVVPPRLMRRHFVRQSSHKMSAPPLSTTAGLTIDEDSLELLQWQPVCEMLPQLSPTFEEINEEDDAPGEVAKDEAEEDTN